MTVDDLERARAALPDDDAMSASATQGDLHAVQARRRDLDARLRRARTAMATLAELRDPDSTWIAFLEEARAALAAELLTPVDDRTPRDRARRANVALSIRVADFGPSVLNGSTYSLDTTALGQLMLKAGFVLEGADPTHNFSGTLPWQGSLTELERDMTRVAVARARAAHDLNEALMDDADRAAKDAEQKQLRDAYNTMRVKQSADPNAPALVVWMDGAPVADESVLSPLQQKALQWARATLQGG